jgi:tetratricopeptide (TPR) repeat protein
LRAFRDDLASARLLLCAPAGDRERRAEGRAAARRALGRFGALDGPGWRQADAVRRLPADEQERLAAEAGELLLLLAGGEAPGEALRLNRLAEEAYGDRPPRALWAQRAALCRRLGRDDEAASCRSRAEATTPRDGWDRHLLARELLAAGEEREAAAEVRQAVADDPTRAASWCLLGACVLDGADGDAVGPYTAAIALCSDHYGLYLDRGLAHLRRGDPRAAESDFRRALELRPDVALAHQHRAHALEAQGRLAEALADLDRVVAAGRTVRALLARARVREGLGDAAGAKADRAEALRTEPGDEEGLIARGVARAQAGDADGALGDFRRAVALNPRSLPGLHNQAHVLAEQRGQTAAAIAALDRVLEVQPRLAPAWGGRAVLHGRLGHAAEARLDARRMLALTPDDGEALFQCAGALALAGAAERRRGDVAQAERDHEEALRLVTRALRRGFGLALLETDHDLDALRGTPRFQALVRAVKELREGD